MRFLRTRPVAPDRWLRQMAGRGVCLTELGAPTPHSRTEAMTVLGGVTAQDVTVVLLSHCVLIVRGGTFAGRTISDVDRLTWIGDHAPGLGDGRVSVTTRSGAELHQPSDPMQRSAALPPAFDNSPLLGATVDGLDDATVIAGTVTSGSWALVLDDGAVVAATVKSPSTWPRPTPASLDEDGVLSCQPPIVIDRPDSTAELWERTELRLSGGRA